MEDLKGKYRICLFDSYLEEQKKCLTVYKKAPLPRAPIRVADYNLDDPSQVFTFEKACDEFVIYTCHRIMVFDVKDNRMENGTPVLQNFYNSGGHQYWNLIKCDKQWLSSYMDNSKIPDTIYSIDVFGFSLTTSNDQVIIEHGSRELYILEEVQ